VSTSRRWLAALAAFMGLNALGGSAYALSGAKAIPREWLDGTPFDDYTVPGVVLGTAVAGSQLGASVALWRGAPAGRPLAIAAAAILLGWITTQLAMIGLRSFLQPFILVWALVTLPLALRLPRGTQRG